MQSFFSYWGGDVADQHVTDHWVFKKLRVLLKFSLFVELSSTLLNIHVELVQDNKYVTPKYVYDGQESATERSVDLGDH